MTWVLVCSALEANPRDWKSIAHSSERFEKMFLGNFEAEIYFEIRESRLDKYYLIHKHVLIN
jgi:hypothetical protein